MLQALPAQSACDFFTSRDCEHSLVQGIAKEQGWCRKRARSLEGSSFSAASGKAPGVARSYCCLLQALGLFVSTLLFMSIRFVCFLVLKQGLSGPMCWVTKTVNIHVSQSVGVVFKICWNMSSQNCLWLVVSSLHDSRASFDLLMELKGSMFDYVLLNCRATL